MPDRATTVVTYDAQGVPTTKTVTFPVSQEQLNRELLQTAVGNAIATLDTYSAQSTTQTTAQLTTQIRAQAKLIAQLARLLLGRLEAT